MYRTLAGSVCSASYKLCRPHSIEKWPLWGLWGPKIWPDAALTMPQINECLVLARSMEFENKEKCLKLHVQFFMWHVKKKIKIFSTFLWNNTNIIFTQILLKNNLKMKMLFLKFKHNTFELDISNFIFQITCRTFVNH